MKSILSLLFFAAVLLSAAAQDDGMRLLEEERLDQSGTVITILFDDSGSMYGPKLQQAKEAFRAWLPTVPDEYRIGLVALNAGQLVEWRRGNKDEVAAAVANLQASGGTPLAETVSRTTQLLRDRQAELPFERHVMLVFTDGQDDTYPPEEVRRRIGDAAANRIETVGIGFHGEGDYLREASTRYFDAADSGELLAGLQKVDVEIGDTSDVRIEPEIGELMKTIGPEVVAAPAENGDTVAAAEPESEGRIPWMVIMAFFGIALYALVSRVNKKSKR